MDIQDTRIGTQDFALPTEQDLNDALHRDFLRAMNNSLFIAKMDIEWAERMRKEFNLD